MNKLIIGNDIEQAIATALSNSLSAALRYHNSIRDYFLIRDRVRRERAILRGMSDHALRDIGISRADANVEANRRYSDVPQDRLALTDRPH